MTGPARMVPLEALLREFAREELRLKMAGDYLAAGWVRSAIVRILRLADGDEPSLDQTGDD